MAFWKKIARFRNASLCFAGIFLFDAAFVVSTIENARENPVFSGKSLRGELGYVLGVLREYRTGLSSIEELRLAEVILEESYSHALDPVFVLALIKTESTFYNWSKSHRGAVGLMQLSPVTARDLAEKLNLRWDGETTLFDPYLNVTLGIHYISKLKSSYRDDIRAALLAYNYGPTYYSTMLECGEATPGGYAERVLKNYRVLKEKADYYRNG